MARTASGCKLVRDPRTGIFRIRFTSAGKRWKLSTGRRDPGEAEVEAARLFSAVVSGERLAGKVLPTPAGIPLDEVAAKWLAEIESSVDPRTFKLYRDTYVGAHFAPFFGTMDKLTTVGCEAYTAKRLGEVSRATVKKEICALRRLCKWAAKRSYLAAMPEIETPGPRVVGTPVANSRKRQFLIFTPSEVAEIIANLPERAVGPRIPEGFCVKERVKFLWETALRPATVGKLRAPEDYVKGREFLTIRYEADKNRWGRELPLSRAARYALDTVCPAEGLIFGDHDCSGPLRKAAVAAGIDSQRAARISEYDLRHSRLTHLGQHTDNLSGLMFLAGHKQPATTARYLRPQQEAAQEVLDSVDGPARGKRAGVGKRTTKRKGKAGVGRKATKRGAKAVAVGRDLMNAGSVNDNHGDSGPILAPSSKPRSAKARDGNPKKLADSEVVRGGGLEPPWLLTASTSS